MRRISRSWSVTYGLLCFWWASVPGWSADTWSNCVSVVGVSEYRAYDSGVYFITEPQVGNCSWGGIPRLRATEGRSSDGVLKSLVALSTAAHLTDKKVQFFYSDSSPCEVKIVALSGYSGQCK